MNTTKVVLSNDDIKLILSALNVLETTAGILGGSPTVTQKLAINQRVEQIKRKLTKDEA